MQLFRLALRSMFSEVGALSVASFEGHLQAAGMPTVRHLVC